MDRTIIEDALLPVKATPVAHYTRIGTLVHFFPSGSKTWASAWATPVQFLNDRKELSLGLEVLQRIAGQAPRAARKTRDIIDNVLSSFGSLETDAFQMSFSGNPDELGQWRGYGANGMGCAVVTNARSVKAVADVAGWIIYEPKRQAKFASKVLNGLQHESDPDLIEKTVIAAACYMKDEGFAPEQEFRLLRFPKLVDIQFRESGNRIVPFVDFLKDVKKTLPVQRVIIGPGWQLSGLKAAELSRNHVVQGIHRLLSARTMYGTEIKSSKIPYDPR